MAECETEFTVRQITDRLHADLIGDDRIRITGLNTLEDAEAGDLTFIGSDCHARVWASSKASASLVNRGIEVPGHDPETRALLVVENADLAMADMLGLFFRPPSVPEPGISTNAIVDPTAEIDPTATIMEWASIGPRTKIGNQTLIGRGVHIAEDCRIGDGCTLREGVIVRERCKIGDRVIIHSNSVIGADGFGYRPDGKGGLAKIPHIGTVSIEDDVEIGACTCVDRGKFGATVIGAHTKLDNLIQIGHNVIIGRGCVIAGMSGIAGSSVIGDYCQFGGQSGVADHLTVGSKVRLAAHSAMMRDAPDGATLAGLPAIDFKEFWRILRVWNKLPDLHKTVLGLSKTIEDLQALSGSSDHEHAQLD